MSEDISTLLGKSFREVGHAMSLTDEEIAEECVFANCSAAPDKRVADDPCSRLVVRRMRHRADHKQVDVGLWGKGPARDEREQPGER